MILSFPILSNTVSLRLFDYNPQTVIPAQAGIQARRNQFKTLDSRFPGMTEKLALFSFDFKFLLIFYPIFALIKGGLRVAPDLLEFPSVLMPLTLAPDVYGKLWRSFRRKPEFSNFGFKYPGPRFSPG